MSTRTANTFRSEQFTYSRASRYFSAEMSDLGFRAGPMPVEIHLISQRTGAVVTFNFVRELRTENQDYEVSALVYRQEANDMNLMLYND